MTKKKKTLEFFRIMLLYLSNRKKILEVKLKPSSKNKLMKDLLKSLLPSQEIHINMKIEVKLKLQRFYNKSNQSKINQIKKEDQGTLF